MSKKVLILSLLFSLCYTTVLAHDFEVKGIFFSINTDNQNSVSVTRNNYMDNSYDGEVVIPQSVTYNNIEYRVTGIEYSAFKGCKNLISVRIPEGILQIASQAFYNCKRLESVDIPNSVKTMGHQVFMYCESLKEIILPQNITSIGAYMFYMCSSLEKCEIFSNIKKIPKYTFDICESLNSISLPETLIEIDTCAFELCRSLENVTLPQNITALKSLAFSQCPLKAINIPKTLTVIEPGAFSVKEYITLDPDNPSFSLKDGILYSKDINTLITSPASTVEAIIPNSVTKIEAYAFADNTNLERVVLPISLDSLSFGIFYNCSSLIDATIPYGVKSIGEMAFAACIKLVELHIPESVESIGKLAFAYVPISNLHLPEKVKFLDGLAFAYCKELQSIKLPNSIDSIPRRLFWECDNLRDVQLPNSIQSIGENAFYFCKSLKSIQIPSSVRKISSDAFTSCSSLKAINVDPANDTYLSRDGVVFTKDMTKLFRCPLALANVEIPLTTQIIGERAFSQCRSLEKLILPESIVELEPFAFQSMNIEEITLPSSLAIIGNGALYSAFKKIYCTSLQPPVWNLPETTFGIYTFSEEVFQNAVLYVPGGTTFRYKNANVWYKFQNIIEFDYSGTDIIEEEKINIKAENGEIIIENKPIGSIVLIYNVLGQKVYSGTNNVIRGLGKDIYIVCVGDIKKKIRL